MTKKVFFRSSIIGWGIVFTAGSFLFIVLFNSYRQLNSSVSTEHRPVLIEVASGKNSQAVADALEDHGLISNSTLFTYLTILTGKASKIQAGEYRLSPDMTAIHILDIITKGKVALHSVTIPEGFSLSEIASLLAKKLLIDTKIFFLLVSDERLIQYLGLDVHTLEGYLFPDTYYFSKGTSEYEIIKKMISNFKKNITPAFVERAKKIGFTENQVVTLASLIEKETGKEEERKIISAVFHNRLQKKMRLQCDPTVIYALKDRFDGNLRRKDLMIDSPYNTYRYRGLPPGPIASPGKTSLEAVLYPEDVDYLYFVSKRDGSHYFSSTLRAHNMAVRKYQLRR